MNICGEGRATDKNYHSSAHPSPYNGQYQPTQDGEMTFPKLLKTQHTNIFAACLRF